VTTCDEDRRKELGEYWNWRKAQVRARERNISLQQALDQQAQEGRAQRAAREKRRAERDPQSRTRATPVFAEGLCQTIRAFGAVDAKDWTRMLIAFHHRDLRRSVIVAEVPGLQARIDAGVAAGTLQGRGDRRVGAGRGDVPEGAGAARQRTSSMSWSSRRRRCCRRSRRTTRRASARWRSRSTGWSRGSRSTPGSSR
jgi:hypothetical protein